MNKAIKGPSQITKADTQARHGPMDQPVVIVSLVLAALCIPTATFTSVLVATEMIEDTSTVALGPLLLNEFEIVPPSPAPAVEMVANYSVYFSNGSARIPIDDANRLKNFALAFSGCNPGIFTIIGHTSSAPFSSDVSQNDANNHRLAALRADAVAVVLQKTVPSLSLNRQPSTERYYLDARRAPSIEHPAEHLNRRADISVEYPKCKPT